MIFCVDLVLAWMTAFDWIMKGNSRGVRNIAPIPLTVEQRKIDINL